VLIPVLKNKNQNVFESRHQIKIDLLDNLGFIILSILSTQSFIAKEVTLSLFNDELTFHFGQKT